MEFVGLGEPGYLELVVVGLVLLVVVALVCLWYGDDKPKEALKLIGSVLN